MLDNIFQLANSVTVNISSQFELLKQFRLWIPPFEVRFAYLVALVAIFFTFNVIRYLIKVRARKVYTTKVDKNSSDPLTLLEKAYLQYERMILHLDLVKIAESDINESKTQPNKFHKLRSLHLYLWKRKSLSLNIFLMILISTLFSSTFLIRPKIVDSAPAIGTSLISAEESIYIHFDVPIDVNTIKFNISPVMEGKWEIVPIVEGLSWAKSAVFYPTHSYPSDQVVVVYVTGIKQWWYGSKLHEEAIEFTSQLMPEIIDVSPNDGAESVAADTEILIKYDAPIGEFVDIKLDIEPAMEYELTLSEDMKSHIVSFEEFIGQDQKVSFSIFRTPQIYNVESKQVISQESTEELYSSSFTTVSTPFADTFSPVGNNILPNAKIEILFDQEMDLDSVVEKLTFSPSIEGEITLSDNNKVVFTPSELLQKNTKFKVSIEEGITSKLKGTTEESLSFEFTTIGHVNVTSIKPLPGSSGVEPATASIQVAFNQEVDRNSAQNSFSITPSTPGAFSWNGNTMVYKPTKLDFGTKYTVKLSKGIKSINGLNSVEDRTFAFTTKQNIYTLNIPYYKQQETFTCNIAATRMVLAYRGVYVSEADVKNSLGIGGNPNNNWVDGYGVHWGPVSSYISKYRKVTVKRGWNVNDLVKEVEKGNVVILWWYNRYSQPPGSFTLESGATGFKGMHSEVVRGFIGTSDKPTAILTNDPWRGKLTYTIPQFNSTWGYINNTALVVE